MRLLLDRLCEIPMNVKKTASACVKVYYNEKPRGYSYLSWRLSWSDQPVLLQCPVGLAVLLEVLERVGRAAEGVRHCEVI